MARALWRGTIPSAVRTGLGSAVYFTILNSVRRSAAQFPGLLGPPGSPSTLPQLSHSANLASGAIARTAAGFLLLPVTVIKVRFESSLYSYASMRSAARDIFRTHGIRGFYSGFWATTIRDAPNAGIYVVLYEHLRKRFTSLVNTYQLGKEEGAPRGDRYITRINFAAGMLAGAGCSFVSNPFDVVKTRIQLQPSEYKGIFHATQKLVAHEGIRSMWGGLMLRMSRKALSSALAWTVYEEVIRRAELAMAGIDTSKRLQ
jgi:solute carrier family 25 protein 38